MIRFTLFVFLLVLKQSVSQQTPFFKFALSDVPINSLSEQTFKSNNTNIKNIILVKLTSCQIVEVDKGSFQQMQYLRFVSLAFNQIKELPVNLFANNRVIKTINFANNEIGILRDGIFANLKLVESITLAHNKIVRIEANVFKDLTMLKTLDLSYNYLKNMWPNIFSNNIDLQKLLLNGNKIDRINDQLFSKLNQLLYLDLNRNLLNETNVKVFASLRSLIMLNLEHNYIKHIEIGAFDNNVNLRAINLNENLIDILENGLFTKLMKLEHLDLKANEIHIIGNDVFPQSPNLATLSLCRNKLMFLNPKTFEKLRGLRTLCIADNYWFCDCKLMEFHAYYMNNDNIKKDTIICYQPEKVADRAWSEISSSEFVCDEQLEIQGIDMLPLVMSFNNSHSNQITDTFPPYIDLFMNSTIPSENDYENENMTMNDMKREIMKISLGGTIYSDSKHAVEQKIPVTVIQDEIIYKRDSPDNAPDSYDNNDDTTTKLPDCLNNKATYFDEKYNKNFIDWRARFLGEFLIMYTSGKHRTFYPNNDIYKRAGSAMLVPNQNGFTFMDPSLSQRDWKDINDYLQQFCSISEQVLNGHSKNMVENHAALEEVSKLIDSLGDVIKSRLRSSGGSMEIGYMAKLAGQKKPAREVISHHMAMNDEYEMTSISDMMSDLSKLPITNGTDGKNLFYYIINARAEGQGHVTINTRK